MPSSRKSYPAFLEEIVYRDEACDWTEALDALSKKKIPAQALITHCFPSEKLMDGLELMKNHKEPYCKVMVSWE